MAASRGQRPKRGVGLAGEAWLKGRAVVVEEVAGSRILACPVPVGDVGLRGGIAVPVRTGNRFLGVIELFTRSRARLEREALGTLDALAAQVGDFLERKRVEHDLAEHAAHIATVSEATRTLSRITDGAMARQTITEATRVVTGASFVQLAEPIPGERKLRLVATAGADLPELEIDLTVEMSGAGIVLLTGERLFVPDVCSHRAISRHLAERAGARSALFEPVMLDDEPVAVLAIAWAEPVEELPARVTSTVGLLSAEAAAAIQRANLLAQLDAAARTDQLTGVPNRRRWVQELPREIIRARRTDDPLSVVLLDIDHFKAFNDAHGHPAGDELLRRVATACAAAVRETDLFARIGGEEFAVLLPSCDGPAAVELADRLRAAVPDEITCSCGVATWDATETEAELTARADQALYRAKQGGRDRTVVAGDARHRMGQGS